MRFAGAENDVADSAAGSVPILGHMRRTWDRRRRLSNPCRAADPVSPATSWNRSQARKPDMQSARKATPRIGTSSMQQASGSRRYPHAAILPASTEGGYGEDSRRLRPRCYAAPLTGGLLRRWTRTVPRPLCRSAGCEGGPMQSALLITLKLDRAHIDASRRGVNVMEMSPCPADRGRCGGRRGRGERQASAEDQGGARSDECRRESPHSISSVDFLLPPRRDAVGAPATCVFPHPPADVMRRTT